VQYFINSNPFKNIYNTIIYIYLFTNNLSIIKRIFTIRSNFRRHSMFKGAILNNGNQISVSNQNRRKIGMNQKAAADHTSWLIMIFLTFVWGCSFILIKKALIAFPPVQLACLRLSISSLAFAPVVFYHRKDINWKRWPKFLAVGATGSGIPAFLFFFAQTEISSSVAGLLNSMTPIWTMLIGVFIFRHSFTKGTMAGIAMGFLGAAILIFSGKASHVDGSPVYAILIIFATLCYASSVNMVQGFFSDTKPIIVSGMSFFLIGPPAIIYLLTTDFTQTLTSHEFGYYSLGSVALLSLFGTVLASILFYYLVQRTSAVFSSSVTYLMPIVAVIWGMLDGEPVSMMHFVGMATILGGVYFAKE
jgi:drug/metabolite transporter (DMT)-like permease